MRLHERAMAFLQKPSGRAMVDRRVARYGLPGDLADDVIQDTLVRSLQAERRGTEPDNVEAFVTTLVQRSARDLLRGHLRRPEGYLAGPADDDATWDPADLAGDTDPATRLVTAEDAAELGGRVDAVRAELVGGLVRGAHASAAALTVLAIVHDAAEPAADTPRPAGGVAAEERIWWAGVFYGGPDGCFGTDDRAPNATTRKRRSRALAATKAALAHAVDRVDGHG